MPAPITMHAAVCRRFGRPIEVEEVELRAPGAGEVLVAVRACAICHSDILFADGAWGGALPAVYGHEAAGVVEEVGAGVDHVAPGDHVVVTLVRSCGRCPCCAAGYHGSCESVFALDQASPLRSLRDGAPIHHGLRTGAFAQHALVEASQTVRIEPDIAFEPASLLACGVITGVGAVINTARVRPGASVAVLGCGGVGLNVVQGARLAGAAIIVGIDPVDGKLDAAERFGATHVLDAKRDDAEAGIKALTAGRGADYVFVAAGAKAAFDAAYGMLARGGAVVLVGMPPNGVTSTIDPGTLANDSKRILGSKMGASNIHRDIPNLVALYRQGRLLLDELVSARYRLDQINEAIAEVKRGGALRNVIIFDEERAL